MANKALKETIDILNKMSGNKNLTVNLSVNSKVAKEGKGAGSGKADGYKAETKVEKLQEDSSIATIEMAKNIESLIGILGKPKEEGKETQKVEKEKKQTSPIWALLGTLLMLFGPVILKNIGKVVKVVKIIGGGIASLVGGLWNFGKWIVTGPVGPFLLKNLRNIINIGKMIGKTKFGQGFLGIITKLKGAFSSTGKLGKFFSGIGKFFKPIVGFFSKIPVLGKIMKGGGSLLKLAGIFGKFLKPILKKLPLIGSILSIADAIGMFKSGDIFGGIIEIGSAIASFIPGVGTGISIGLSLFNTARRSKVGKKISAKVVDFMKPFIAKIKPVIKWIPPFYTIFKIQDSITRFKTGDWKGGLIDIGMAVAGLIPGVGPAMEWAIGFFSRNKETIKKVAGKTFDIVKSISDKLQPILQNFAPFFTFYKVKDAITKIKAGDWKGGLGDLAIGVLGLVPGLAPVLNVAMGFFNFKKKQKEGLIPKEESFLGNLKKKIKEVVDNILGSLGDILEKPFKGVINWFNDTFGTTLNPQEMAENIGKTVTDFFNSVFNIDIGEVLGKITAGIKGILKKAQLGVEKMSWEGGEGLAGFAWDNIEVRKEREKEEFSKKIKEVDELRTAIANETDAQKKADLEAKLTAYKDTLKEYMDEFYARAVASTNDDKDDMVYMIYKDVINGDNNYRLGLELNTIP